MKTSKTSERHSRVVLTRMLLTCVFVATIASILTWYHAGLLVSASAKVNKTAPSAASREVDDGKRKQLVKSFSQLPLSFETNQGQTDKAVKFMAQAPGYQLFLTDDEAVMVLRKPTPKSTTSNERMRPNFRRFAHKLTNDAPQEEVVRMKLSGALKHPTITALDAQAGKKNYFRGNDPQRWQTNVPLYGRVQYANVYEGIDLVYYGNQQQLEFDFVVAPGADPRQITLDFAGVESVKINESGELVLKTPAGEIRQHAPELYQEASNQRKSVKGRYVILGERQVGFAVEGYDNNKSLVIDPVLVYSTYLGGLGSEYLSDMAVDSSGSVYLTGNTDSTNYPGSVAGQLGGVSQTANGGTSWTPKNNGLPTTTTRTVVIDPVNPNTLYCVNGNFGTAYVHKTTDGGTSWSASATGLPTQEPSALYVHPSSTNTLFAGFFNGANVYKSTNGGATWSVSSTGIPSDNFVFDFAIHPSAPNTVYASTVTGVYKSTDGGANWANTNSWPPNIYFHYLSIDPNAPNTLYLGTSNGLYKSTNASASWTLTTLTQQVSQAVIHPSNSSIVYATTDGGVSKSLNSGATWTPINSGLCNTGFTRKLVIDPNTPNTLYLGKYACGLYKTTDGGTNWSLTNAQPNGTWIRDIAHHPSSSNILYVTLERYQDAFVTKLNASGSAIVYSTILGGESFDSGSAVKLDGNGNPCIAGDTGGFGFPTTAGAYQTVAGSGGNAFFTRFDSNGAISYSTLLGGTSGFDGLSVSDLAMDSTGRAHIVGTTESTTMPTTPGAYQTTNSGIADIFYLRLNPLGSGISDLQYATYLGGSEYDYSNRILLNGTQVVLTGGTLSADYDVTASAYDNTYGGGICGTAPDTYPCQDAILTRLNPVGGGTSDLAYSTYLGGTSDDVANDLVGGTIATVVGYTQTTGFPTTGAAYQTTPGGGYDGFVTTINTNVSGVSGLTYSTLLGGNSNDSINRIVQDNAGYFYLAGITNSTNFPLLNPLDSTMVGGEAFVARLGNPAVVTGTNQLRFSTLFGGSNSDYPTAIRLDNLGNVYLAGGTGSSDFPTLNPLQANNSGGDEGFVLKFTSDACPLTTLNQATLPSGVVGSSYSQTLTASGGAAPYRFSFTNTVTPPGFGLTLSATGLLSGTPTASGSYDITVLVTDANGCTAVRNYVLQIGLTVNPPVLPTGLFNTLYSQTLTAIGGTAPYSFTATGLPSWLTLTTGGILSGTPTASGTFTFTVTVTDAGSVTGTRTYFLAIYPAAAALVVTTTVDEDNTNPAACSLREAILSANTNTAVGGCAAGLPGPDRIVFSLGTGPYAIAIVNVMPSVTEPLWIDGATGSSSPDPALQRVELAGPTGTLVTALNFNGGRNSIVRNLVINRFAAAISLQSGNDNVVIEGCYVGTDATGSIALGNNTGILISSSYNRIGGTSAQQRNIISGNVFTGISTVAQTAVGNLIQGNYIGLDASGTADLGNGAVGIQFGSGRRNIVGGNTPSARNVISGNGPGFSDGRGLLLSTQNIVQGNFIGTDASGTAPLGNSESGISAGLDNIIGGFGPGEGNLIAFNGSTASSAGIVVSISQFSSAQNNAVLGNSIHSNFGIGIDLRSFGVNGVTPNDVSDGDGGANLFQNFPVLNTAITTGSAISFNGSLNSVASKTYRLEFFANDACDASGYGEGQQFLGATSVTTDGSGNATITATLSVAVTAGKFITATATDPDGNTSEFSACRVVTAPCPTISATPASLPNGQASVSYSQQLTGAGGASPYSFVLNSGSLPSGVTLSSGGLLSGTPTSFGNFAFAILITDANGCNGLQNFNWTVTPPCPTISLGFLSNGIANASYNQTITISAGTSPFTFALTAGALPTGLTLNTTTGQVSGTPTTTGTSNFTVTVTDANGCTGTRAYTLVVNPCNISALTPSSQTIKGKVGTHTFTVIGTGCPWMAISQAPWIVIMSNASGLNTAIVSYVVTVNTTGSTRVGTIAVNNETYTVTQLPHNAATTGVLRPTNGNLYLKNQNSTGFADLNCVYGSPGDLPVIGDWNGDGVDTIGVYRNGVFYLRNSNTTGFADIVLAFGAAGDQPIAGDWNGDGIDTIGIYRNGIYYLRDSNTSGFADIVVVFGTAGDQAIIGDWNGDGIDTVGVFRPTNGNVYLRNTNTTGFADLTLVYGLPSDQPVIGDWDGNGTDTIGIKRGQLFYLRNSNTSGFADIVFALGLATDIPIAGDWDGLP